MTDNKIDKDNTDKGNTDKAEEVVEETTEDVTEEVTDDVTNETENSGAEATENESADEDNNQNSKEGEKKGLFKKDKKKDKKDELIEELTDKYKRTFAEFDNFRKRSEKEKSAMYEVGAKDVIEKILPVVDNFERGFKAVSEEELATPFAEGMDKIYKQLLKTLEDLGVKEIEAEGNEFDPSLHNAVMHVEDETLGENIVAEVLQKGYMYRDSVVRHSMVKVAN
ncbi:nucleotide exchange factor GrpE [Bovifimicola ammoniilytica]|uniref:nucleotide exchange factor GrpE n=1 Tax=Bovifimicola ammoniilytica TaxID=2981720 RepID=UPI00033FD3BC|nr:nucleotide exchange factor GrpE [Bovifimicola ammoniilytica]MCU6753158.1 nucleotide exchange factor GrpE [Bovifimicola ammoniilytica]CCZ05367.1 protein GrpE [Eubacterium sp. CAG:603]SCJ55807.1 HSP-70 cofactor [uncultured Eubacterium sp.]